ncbi:MAG: helix-turn-helix transcriptional regulator [Rhodocyclaceae bacterium]|nr:helix-turn-helix transcriptional regulator [Rhodocyclaceae bacterium]MDZ4215102.1 helix-turn-helix transcriptional regulator [Rhodocyclaceae bacterium]
MPKVRAFEIAPLPFEVTASLQILGHRIAVGRKERGHSQREFADMLGIAPKTLVSLERGAPTVQIGHYARALWMLEIQDAILCGVGVDAQEPS